MGNILKIASRNLLRNRRRTLLTSALVVPGIVAVRVFVAVAGSFKAMMVGQITDSMLGHVQVHRRGYVASIDSLPLNLNMPAGMADKVAGVLGAAVGTVLGWAAIYALMAATVTRSYSITPELLYTGRKNLELRARAVFLGGGQGADFGEKQNARRIELLARLYF